MRAALARKCVKNGACERAARALAVVDTLTIGYGCQIVSGATWIAATMTASGLDVLPSGGMWRMNFSTNPPKPGVVDRADPWFVEADTDATGVRTLSWGTAARQSDASIEYAIKGRPTRARSI